MDLRPYKIEVLKYKDADTGEEFWRQFADAHNEAEAGRIASDAWWGNKYLTEDEIRVKYKGEVIC